MSAGSRDDGRPEPGLGAERQLELLLGGEAEAVPREGLVAKLERSVQESRPLRVKLGLDPTAAEVTLGWAVVLRKLRQFQDLGHTAVLIVGDFTARVGDPSGKSETRPRLDADVVRGFAERLLGQFGKILSEDRLELRYNSEWLEGMSMEDILRLTASYTVARMLERDDFANRLAEGRPISIMEFLYPLLQGMDSVAVRSDIELGGNDQLFNLLVGRDLQREYGQEPQVALTMPLLVGLDGVRVMGQSVGNYVGIAEPPGEQFGKLMSIPDGLIARYLRLCTDVDTAEVEQVEAGLAHGSRPAAPEKRRMAREVVALYHGTAAADEAEARFDAVFKRREIPDDVPEVPLPLGAVVDGRVWLPRLLVAVGLAASNGEARRQIVGGAIRLNGDPVTDPGTELDAARAPGTVLQRGARRFVRIGPPG